MTQGRHGLVNVSLPLIEAYRNTHLASGQMKAQASEQGCAEESMLHSLTKTIFDGLESPSIRFRSFRLCR